MANIGETVFKVVHTSTWNERVAQIRLIPQKHGTGEHTAIYAAIARELYAPHLAADFAYIHDAPFYSLQYFQEVYAAAQSATNGFTETSEAQLTIAIQKNPEPFSYSVASLD
jgi:hypothetical protein